MDTEQLVDKFVNGEITEEQFEQEKAKLTPEEQEKLKKEADVKLPDAVQKLKDVRRGIDKIAQDKKNEEEQKSVNLATKLRQENYETARTKFFTDLGIEKEEDRRTFEEGFKKFDSGHVTSDNILKDMEKYYASTQSDEFFKLKKEKLEREKEAEEINAQNGGSGSSGGGNASDKKVSKEVQHLINESKKIGRNLTPEQAQRALDIAKNKGRIG